MGATLSSFGGRKGVQKIINKAGLPLEISDSESGAEQAPLSPYTEAYPAPGWFTGVKSTVTVPASADAVYDSLSKDLHHIFTPMTECDDEIEEDDGKGGQVIFRIVRIPFQVAFVSGNLKLRLHVEQNRKTRKIMFESLKEGRLISKFIATFDIVPDADNEDHTVVTLDSKISAKQLPPPPFKGMVKDVMVRKMDACMVDIVDFHSKQHDASEDAVSPSAPASRQASAADLARQRSGFLNGLLSKSRKSLDRGRNVDARKTTDKRRSFDFRKVSDLRKSLDRRRDSAENWHQVAV